MQGRVAELSSAGLGAAVADVAALWSTKALSSPTMALRRARHHPVPTPASYHPSAGVAMPRPASPRHATHSQAQQGRDKGTADSITTARDAI